MTTTTGTCRHWNVASGFGFVEDDDSGEVLFVHERELRFSSATELRRGLAVGQRLRYAISPGRSTDGGGAGAGGAGSVVTADAPPIADRWLPPSDNSARATNDADGSAQRARPRECLRVTSVGGEPLPSGPLGSGALGRRRHSDKTDGSYLRGRRDVQGFVTECGDGPFGFIRPTLAATRRFRDLRFRVADLPQRPMHGTVVLFDVDSDTAPGRDGYVIATHLRVVHVPAVVQADARVIGLRDVRGTVVRFEGAHGLLQPKSVESGPLFVHVTGLLREQQKQPPLAVGDDVVFDVTEDHKKRGKARCINVRRDADHQHTSEARE